MIKNFCMKNDSVLLKRIFSYLKPYKYKFITAFICTLFTICIGIVQPLFWGKIIDCFFQKSLEPATRYILYSLVLGILLNIFTYVQTYLLTSLNQNIIVDLKQSMYQAILNLPIKSYDDVPSGEFMSRLHGDVGEVADTLTGTLLNTIIDCIRLIALGITIFSINYKLAVIVVVTFPISFYIFNKYGKKIRESNKELSKLNDAYYSESGQVIWGIREIRSLGIKENKLAMFKQLSQQLKKHIIYIILLNTKSQTISNTISFLAQMIIAFVGGIMVVNNTLDITYFIAFYSYSGQFSSSILNISRVNINLQQTMNSLERIFLLMDGLNYTKEKDGIEVIKNVRGSITFENISFRYSKGGHVLENVSLHIPATGKTAIVGSSGSGKSTIFNLILKFYSPSQGCILIDGININDFREEDLRKHISIVRQEPILFRMSIKENLLLAKPDASEEEIESACKNAFIHDYIETLPDKYHSMIGENGITLSGGQRQRLAIARALLKKSQIILFDEATSALDNESQFFIKKAIDRLAANSTVVLIAHRLSTIIEADKIYVMDKGKVTGYGNHHTLISTNSIYQKLYATEVQLISESCREVI